MSFAAIVALCAVSFCVGYLVCLFTLGRAAQPSRGPKSPPGSWNPGRRRDETPGK